MGRVPVKVVVTGAAGLLGQHASVHLHAENCAAVFKGNPAPVELVRLDRAGFNTDAVLAGAMAGADAVLHFAGINRASDAEIADGNPGIATRLAEACAIAGVKPHIVYANSIHASGDSVYGRSKAKAAEILAGVGGAFTDLILPHIFGEGARPNYNNVTATLIDGLVKGRTSEINPDGQVQLLHAGAAVAAGIAAIETGDSGSLQPTPRVISVPDLWRKLAAYHESYGANIFPDLSDPFDVALFNTYRTATYPGGWPRAMTLNTDARGRLFEAVKGGGGGQTFVSTTEPGVTRGDHFHLTKVERFLVLEGQATIRIRKALTDEVWSFEVDGDTPMAVDMPTLHTHSIENTGATPLLTLFWTHDLFDPNNPDTYADKVIQ
jgi:UDP-2-acetamido-2,6-beta-L-arabino-hexul-4-ose reductase